MIDRFVCGMKVLNITQIGSLYDGRNHLSHPSYELDLAGSDSGVDFWYNKMPNTGWKAAARFGTYSTGNTILFHSVDPKTGKPKEVMCADGKKRLLTIAMTHSNRSYAIGRIYKYGEVMYTEGVAGRARGYHIHTEFCEGHVRTKIKNRQGYYNLPNMLDARKVMFILDGFTTVKNTQGLAFQHCSSVPVEEVQEYEEKTTTANLNIRKGPSTKDAVIVLLPKGTKVRWYWEHSNDYEWYKVYVPSRNLQGWVSSKYLK